MISATTKLIGLIGWPVEHSLSPAMQNAALGDSGFNCVYVPLPVDPDKLGDAVAGLRAFNFLGANVTVPHKEKVMRYLDEIHPDARRIGAVNTIVAKEGRLVGYNTDAGGFTAALLRHHFDPLDKNAIIFGAGGAARAIVHSLIAGKCAGITIGTRSGDKAEKFAADFGEFTAIRGYSWDSPEFRRAHWDVDLLVNTTPVGMDGIKDKSLPVYWTDVPLTTFAADTVYNPPLTAFLRQARLRGCRGMNGLAMLVEQGALSFELWLGETPHREIMYETLVQKI
ncbi:MAG: shikimate dehydrogenase [Acidaminococcales bacterium]|jgi:shikimate dehydrogenase|nr:shikimate dehydrogenase [Acidaminococcales bacterium]